MLVLEFKDTLPLDDDPLESLMKLLQVLHFKGHTKYTVNNFICTYNQIDSKTVREFCKDLGSIMFENIPIEILQCVNDTV